MRKGSDMMKSAILAILLLATGTATAAEQVKLGTYDSRVVALACARSQQFAASMRARQAEMAAAKAAGRQERVRELDQEGAWMQVRLHQRTFSTAGAADMLKGLESQLPMIAEKAGVAAIVSRWELPYSSPSIELVDVTQQVAALFAPDAATRKLMDEVAAMAPQPFDEVPLED